MWKWTRRILVGLLTALVLAVAVVFTWSEIKLNRTFAAEKRTLLLTSRPEVQSEGERLAQVFGCFHGCHGADMEGEVFAETPFGDRIVAPNLKLAMQRYSVPELEAIIRQGVKPDGSSVLGMPAASFATLSDRDLAAILSYLREVSGQSPDPGHSRYGLLARSIIVAGLMPLEAAAVRDGPWTGRRDDPLGFGEYLAMNACSECHGLDLRGTEDFTPSLAVATAYDREQFGRLLKTGVGLGERDLGLMREAARNRFARMTNDEADALHAFLKERFQ